MSPFEVVSESDGSFQANSVGTGSRLTLELKDTPVAYAVINREFIDALGITDLREAATWATGQTFYYADNGGTAFGTPSQYFSRGLRTDQNGGSNFGAQRNFYQNANTGGDSYAVESYDFGRGPNAALFGQSGGAAGGLAGVSSIQSKKARFDSSTTTIGLELGQWNYHRATVDYNRPINDRLGVRINAVDSDSNGYRFGDMRASRGLTVTTTWKATNSTDVTLEGSTEMNAFHTVGGGMDEYLSGWDGSTVFNGPIINSMIPNSSTAGTTSAANASYGTIAMFGNSGLTYNGEPNGVQRISNNPFFMYNPSTGAVMNWQNFAATRRADQTSRTPLWSSEGNQSSPNGSYFVRGTNNQGRFGTDVAFGVGRSWYGKYDYLPADMYNQVIQNSKFRIPSRRFTYTLDTPTSKQLSRDLQLTISQRVGTNLYLEVGGDINRNHQQTKGWDNPSSVSGGGRTSTLDINLLLPNGQPNPNFLDTYAAMPLSNRIDDIGDQAIRANLAYVIDAGKWGNYTFNLNGNLSYRTSTTQNYNLSLRVNADPRRWPNDQLRLLSPASDLVRGYSEPINGQTVQFTDVDWTDGNNPVVQAQRTMTPNWIVSSQSESLYKSRYALIQTTAKWWEDRVVFTGALRRDYASGLTRNSVDFGDLPVTWNGSDLPFKPDAPADWASLDPNRPRVNIGNGINERDPAFLSNRYRNDYNSPMYKTYGNTKSLGLVLHVTDWLSPYINYSNSFIPATTTSFDLNGDPRLPTEAYGYDYGVQSSLMNNKLNVKWNYYSDYRKNDSFFTPGRGGGNAVYGNINALYQANFWTDTDPAGRNARGIDNLPGQDYQDLRNFGYELEVTANPMPGLRITANGSNGSTFPSNQGREVRDYVPAHAALFKQLLEDAGGMLDTTQSNPDAPSAPGYAVGTPIAGNGVGIDTTSAVDNYNNLWANYQLLLTSRTLRRPLQPTINAYADYTVQSGPVRGLRIGGGIQWQGSIMLGTQENDTILDPNNPIPTAIDDPTKDQYSIRFVPGSYLSQMNFGYTWRLDNGNTLVANLRINNPVNNLRIPVGDGNVPFGLEQRQPQGDLTKPDRVASPALPARFPEPINARLSLTYSFGGSGRFF